MQTGNVGVPVKSTRKPILAVCILLALSIVSTQAADYTDEYFAANEAYVAGICADSNLVKNNAEYKTMCTAYYAYVQAKIKNSESTTKDIKNKLANTETSMSELQGYIDYITGRLSTLNAEIKGYNDQIATLEASINLLNEEIETQKANILALRNKIKERLVVMQSYSDVNMLFEFVSGAQDFNDLLSRIDGVNDISNYDKNMIAQYKTEQERLQVNLDEVQRQNDALVVQRQAVQVSLDDAESLKESYNISMAKLEAEQAAYAAELESIQLDTEDLKNQLNNINLGGGIPASYGWILPIESGFWVSAGTWYYPGGFDVNGGVHYGIDFATSYGKTIVAPANGYVIAAANGCPDTSSWTGTCASRGGNYLHMIIEVSGQVYGLAFFHMRNGSVIAANQQVNQGQKIGEVASSGMSTGNHLHNEIIWLGPGTVQSYINDRWNGSTSHGLTYSLSNTCSAKGNVYPCRVKPESIYNLSVGEYR